MDDASRGAPPPASPQSSSAPDPLIGRVINDRYRVVGLIARGGMGKVYRAEQAPLGRLVALKVLNPNYTGDSDPEFHKRFFLEASIASKLTHPNTVTIFDYGRTDDDIYYIAMELLEGRTLHRALRDEGCLSFDRVMHIARQICRSLREAHALGVIHRDLKPANIYLMQHGDESDFVKVLDFGLVKNLNDKAEELTQAGLFMGSPKYMSPEQIRGEPIDARVDVYALGVIMYEMITGKVPFDRPNSVNILMAHIQEQVPAIGDVNPDARVPYPLEQIVQRCMVKNPAARYHGMDEVLAALKQAGGHMSMASGEYGLVDEYSMGSSASVRLGRDMLHAPTPSGVAPLPPGAMDAMPSVQHRSASSRLPLVLAMAAAVVTGTFVYLGRGGSSVAPPPQSAQRAPAQQDASRILAASGQAAMREAPSTQFVLVTLRSTPSGATVVVGDKEYGPTPTQFEWTGDEAADGREVTFRFQRRGYRDLTVTRTLRGDRLEVEAPPLDPIPVRRPSTSSQSSQGF